MSSPTPLHSRSMAALRLRTGGRPLGSAHSPRKTGYREQGRGQTICVAVPLAADLKESRQSPLYSMSYVVAAVGEMP